MFHKNDAVNQYVVDKVLCQRYTVEHKELVYPACQRTSCYSKFFRALSQGCNVPQKRCCQSMCGRQGIVLEIYGGGKELVYPAYQRTSCYSKFLRALSQGCNVPQKRCCQSICGRQGINVLEIYGRAQGISLPSAMRYIIFYKSSFEDEHK